MAEKLELELLLKGGAKSVKTMGELEQALSDAREEIKGVAKGSEDFERLASAIQDASSEVKTLEKQMEGLEPQQKAEAFLKMGEGIAGGFMAAQGAMGLIGIESENLEKIQVKVQSAIAIAMGIRMMSEAALMAATAKRVAVEKISLVQGKAIGLVTKANTIATVAAAGAQKALSFAIGMSSTALKILKVAIISTGIGALVVAIGAVIGLTADWSSKTDEQNEALARQKKAIEDNMNAHMKSAEGLREKLQYQKDLNDAETEQDKNLVKANKTLSDQEARLAKLVAMQGRNLELVKEHGDNKEWLAANQAGIDSVNNSIRAVEEQITTQYNYVNSLSDTIAEQKRLAQEEEAENQRRRSRSSQRRQQRKADAAALLSLEQEVTLLLIENEDLREQKKIEIDRENALRDAEEIRNKEIRENTIHQINLKFDALEKELADEKKLKEEEDEQIKLDKKKENLNAIKALEDEFALTQLDEEARELEMIDRKYAEILEKARQNGQDTTQLEEDIQKQKTAIETKYSKIRTDNAKAETDLKEAQQDEQLQAMSQLAGSLGQLAGDNKALAVASATIDTYVGANKAFAQGGTAGFLTGAAIIAAGLNNVRTILQQDVGDGGGGDEPPAPPEMAAPNVGAFELSGAVEQEPVRAFVVTDEMTSSQTQLANIRRRATI